MNSNEKIVFRIPISMAFIYIKKNVHLVTVHVDNISMFDNYMFFIFDRGPALFFLEIVHENIYYGNDPPFADLRKAVVGYKRKYMCTEYW